LRHEDAIKLDTVCDISQIEAEMELLKLASKLLEQILWNMLDYKPVVFLKGNLKAVIELID